RRHPPNTDLARRAAGSGWAGGRVAVMPAAAGAPPPRRAIQMIRGGGGPCFLEFRTYRFRAHSLYDADRYRDKAEIDRWKARDPISRLAARLRAAELIDDHRYAELQASIDAEIDAAITAAEEAPEEPVTDLTRHVYAERI
ncbi:thiamine pyrophosphate-dependent enzyme, partial [Nocardia carnea]|uniref:thiamine pyrophosphate-dependent enzyme n=1 Tax=Nocardia carnea TaxID=37328 RepID=UPI0024546F6C